VLVHYLDEILSRVLLPRLPECLGVDRLHWVDVLQQHHYRLPGADLHSMAIRVWHGGFLVLDTVVEFKQIDNEFLDPISERNDRIINLTASLH